LKSYPPVSDSLSAKWDLKVVVRDKEHQAIDVLVYEKSDVFFRKFCIFPFWSL
jgi:hypothetical protein